SLRAEHPNLLLFLAPRRLELLDRVEPMLAAAGLRVIRRTQLDHGPVMDFPYDVVLLDTFGELAAIYQLSDLAFVGGSLVPHGGQNILEPAALGKPVIFGPHMHNFRDSVALLLQADAAIQIDNEKALLPALRSLLDDPIHATRMGERAAAAVRNATGATSKTCDLLEEFRFLE
ncbi:hypothetical protein JW905_13865, partial [bacterium]|nr:hypothetical protein [candidate division CSSED10-310 bacterium]